MKKMSIKLNVPSKDEQKIREAKRGPVAPRGRPKATATKNAELASTSQKPTKALKPATKDFSGVSGKEDGTIRIKDLLSPSEPSKEAGIIGESRDTQQPDPKNVPDLNIELKDRSSLSDPAPPVFLPPPTSIPAPAPPLDFSNIPPPTLPQPNHAAMPQPFPEPAMLPSNLPLPPSSPPAPPSPQPKAAEKPNPAQSPTTPKHTRRELPIFSSTSPIPFGKTPSGHQSINQMLAPETRGQNPGFEDMMHTADAPDAVHLGESIMAGNRTVERKGEETRDDVFDVRDSPRR
ncbi:MAG: hypothetical protein Q9184_008416 [Pyrenodesmia sp. 2 TL-2023]